MSEPKFKGIMAGVKGGGSGKKKPEQKQGSSGIIRKMQPVQMDIKVPKDQSQPTYSQPKYGKDKALYRKTDIMYKDDNDSRAERKASVPGIVSEQMSNFFNKDGKELPSGIVQDIPVIKGVVTRDYGDLNRQDFQDQINALRRLKKKSTKGDLDELQLQK